MRSYTQESRSGRPLSLKVLIVTLSVTIGGTVGAAESPSDEQTRPLPQATQLDLSGTFHTRSPWRLVVTEGPQVKDYGENDAPGALVLCLHKGPAGPCISAPVTVQLRNTMPEDPNAWEPHYLLSTRFVYPLGHHAEPLLLIVTGSLNSTNGNQIVSTELVRYDRAHDTFVQVLALSTGRNNNEEIRFIDSGPLRGSVISAEPQEGRPYGYWIVVRKATPKGVYRPVLRFLSSTRYNDGNQLAVIDSEMPNIERRLGLWKPGYPLPTPRHAVQGKLCIKPELKHGELWCK